MTGPRYVTAAEAARRLGVHKSTMARWIAAGRAPAEREGGGHWKVSVAWVGEARRQRERGTFGLAL